MNNVKIIKLAEIFGSEAFVYTGSKSTPDTFIELINSGEFNPGGGSGALYGKALYTVYNLGSILGSSPTLSGKYGNYIYKLKVNLYGFISFNQDITKIIYGEPLLPSEQFKMIYGFKKSIDSLLKSIEQDYSNRSFTSHMALKSSKFLNGIVKGLIFTGATDGDVAVIYDSDVVTPIAWGEINKESKIIKWNKFKKEQVSSTIGRGMIGSFESEKYLSPDRVLPQERPFFKFLLSSTNHAKDSQNLNLMSSLLWSLDDNEFLLLIDFILEQSKKTEPNKEVYLQILRVLSNRNPEKIFLYYFDLLPIIQKELQIYLKNNSKLVEDYFLMYPDDISKFAREPWLSESILELNKKSYIKDTSNSLYRKNKISSFLKLRFIKLSKFYYKII